MSSLLLVCISSHVLSTLDHWYGIATLCHQSRRPSHHSRSLEIMEGFSSDVMVRSNAVVFPKYQLRTRTSADLVLLLSCPKPLPTSTWAETFARLRHSTNSSRSLFWGRGGGGGKHIAPMFASNSLMAQWIQGMAWTNFATDLSILFLLL